MPTEAMIPWLRDSDPTLRWQVERDLMGEPAEVWVGEPSPRLTFFGTRVLDWYG